MKQACKVSTCSHPAKKEGFCGWCHKKYIKGKYLFDGTLTYQEEKKQHAKKRREAKREEKKNLAIWKERKERIKSRLSLPILRSIQEEHAETRTSIGCPVFSIRISEAECYGRIYLRNKHKACTKCHLYDHRMDFLEDFIDKEEKNGGQKK